MSAAEGSPAEPQVFRFRPRYVALPWLAGAVGVGLMAAGVVADWMRGLLAGAMGPIIGLGYYLSPAWRLRVLVDDQAIEVRRQDMPRFRLPWGEIVRVLHTPSTKTCYVDGGSAEKSLLVPGPGAPAPYRIERREALYDAIVAHTPPARLQEVVSLETALAPPVALDVSKRHD